MKHTHCLPLLCCLVLAFPSLAHAAEGLQLPAYDAKGFCEKKAKSGFLKECLQEEEAAYNRLISGVQTTAALFEQYKTTLDTLQLESYTAFEHCLKKGDIE
jgi:hypothetical protein